jgi:diguanylate cyclase (GGDEF)-like protein
LATNASLGLFTNAALLITAKRFPDPLRQSLSVWAGAGLYLVAAWMMLSMKMFGLFALASLGYAGLLGLALGEFLRSLRIFSGHPAPIRTSMLLALVFALFNAVFYFYTSGVAWRGSAMSMLSSAALVAIAARALRVQALCGSAALITATAAAIIALLQLARVLYTMMHPQDSAMYNDGAMQLVLTSIVTAGFAVMAFGMCLMCSQRLNLEYRDLLRFDPLTRAINRAPWRMELDQFVAREAQIAVALIDLDYFKRVNDQYGHAAGDATLQAVVACARGIFGETVGRLGGEEFAAYQIGAAAEHMPQLCERFREAVLAMRIKAGEREIQVSVSVGYVLRTNPKESGSELLLRADQAMYQAKQQGRNLVVSYA